MLIFMLADVIANCFVFDMPNIIANILTMLLLLNFLVSVITVLEFLIFFHWLMLLPVCFVWQILLPLIVVVFIPIVFTFS